MMMAMIIKVSKLLCIKLNSCLLQTKLRYLIKFDKALRISYISIFSVIKIILPQLAIATS